MNAVIEFRHSEAGPTPADRVFDSIVELAPNPDNPTPMVRLSGRTNPHPGYELLVKLEGMNPFGSIKDRTALHMLRGLRLRADQVLVEPSAGNTGIALAAMANAGGAPIASSARAASAGVSCFIFAATIFRPAFSKRL